MNEDERRRKRCCCGSKKRNVFKDFILVFKKYIQEKTLKDFPLLSIDAHKISTVTVSDHVKPYAAVAVKLGKKVMRECGHLKSVREYHRKLFFFGCSFEEC